MPEALSFSGAVKRRGMNFESASILPSSMMHAVETLDLTGEEEEQYYELRRARIEGFPSHQAGGVPDPVQHPGMGFMCQLVSNGVTNGDTNLWLGSGLGSPTASSP